MFKKMLIVVALLGVISSTYSASYRWIFCMKNSIALADSNTAVTLNDRIKTACAIKCARWLDSTDNLDTYAGSGINFTSANMTEWCSRGNLNVEVVYKRVVDYFYTSNSIETAGYDMTDAQINYIIHRKYPVFAALIGTGPL